MAGIVIRVNSEFYRLLRDILRILDPNVLLRTDLAEIPVHHWELEVDANQARLRVPNEICKAVSWLKSLPAVAKGIPGKQNQLILTIEPWQPATALLLTQFLSAAPPSANDWENPVIVASRYFGFGWEVKCSAADDRVAIKLPNGARLMSIGPPIGEPAVVFAIGDVVEIWHLPVWKSEYQTFQKREAEIRRAAEDYIAAKADSPAA